MTGFIQNIKNTIIDKVKVEDPNRLKARTKKVGKAGFSIFRAIFLFSLCLVLLYPLLIMLSISFRVPSEIFDQTVVWIPKTFTLDAYKRAWSQLNFPSMFFETAKVAILGTACQLISCILVGYGFARFDFPFKKLLFGILLLTIIVPTQVLAIPTMLYYQKFDLFGIGSVIGLFTGETVTVSLSNNIAAYLVPAITGAGIRSGLFIFIFIQFFRNLPNDLADAAYIDGCGRFRTFIQIMLPLSGAAILTVTLFSLVWYWNDNTISTLHYDGINTVTSVLRDLRGALNADHSNRDELAMIPQMQAAALMSMTPLIVMYIALQKYFTEGIERTGIVG